MTEFYNCLIFLQFFTASFTIVLTPQGCARERIFSMKEQLYTIPLNDAVNAQDECPFCFIHRSIEQDLLDFVLGSGSSYMEADIREQTDKAGFCRYHFQKMFDYGNTLGNAWILKTHYQRMIREMQQEFASFRPGKSSLLGKFKKSKAMKIPSACGSVQKRIPAISVPSIKIPTPDIWTPFSTCGKMMKTSAIKS